MSDNPGGPENNVDSKKTSREKMDPETREAMEGLMRDMIEGGLWGYKSRNDPAEREIAFQSEAMAEKLFAHLYADDPHNAKMKWQKYSGKPADKGLISRAEAIILETPPHKALDKLTSEQNNVLKTVKQFLGERDSREREKDMSNLRVALGDAKQRKKQYRRQATEQITAQEREVDGLTIAKGFFLGATRISDDYLQSWRENKKINEVKQVMSDIRNGMRAGDKSKVFQSVRGATQNNQAGIAMVGLAAGAADYAARKVKDFILKMTGASRDNAIKNAPEKTKILLLPPPDRSIPNNGFGGPELNQGLG